MKHLSRFIFVAAWLVIAAVLVLPASAARLPVSTVFQSGIETPTLPPAATNTPLPPATDTATPPATETPVPATETLVPTATETPLPTATGTQAPTATPTPIPTYVPPPPPPPPPPIYGILGYHIVRSGETLYCIGRAYGVSPWAIAYVNYLHWPYYVYTGQQLAIPNSPWYNIPPGPVCVPQFGGTVPTPTPVPTSTPGPGVTPIPPACRFQHFVLPGQTLYGISLYYGVNMYTVAAANHITNLNLIYAYTYLCIP